MNQRKKIEKKKTREREVQEKLRNRRENQRRKMKELRKEAFETEQYNKLIRKRIQLEQWAKLVEGKIPDNLQERIQNNINILKGLEESYAEEQRLKQEARENGGKPKSEELKHIENFLSESVELKPETDLEEKNS
jgi:hypothetical protein